MNLPEGAPPLTEDDLLARVGAELDAGCPLVTVYLAPPEEQVYLATHHVLFYDEAGTAYTVGPNYCDALTRHIRARRVSWRADLPERRVLFGPASKAEQATENPIPGTRTFSAQRDPDTGELLGPLTEVNPATPPPPTPTPGWGSIVGLPTTD